MSGLAPAALRFLGAALVLVLVVPLLARFVPLFVSTKLVPRPFSTCYC